MEDKNFEEEARLEDLAASVANSSSGETPSPDGTVPPPPDESPAGGSAESASKDEAAGGEIDDLLKKYEELPKSASADSPQKPKDSKKKSGKKLPVVPVAAAGFVILVVVLFLLFKPKKKEVAVVTRHPAAGKPVAKPASPAKPRPKFVLPDAGSIIEKKEDGVMLNIFDTSKSVREIKLFYQKKMAEAGFEILSAKKNEKVFGMSFGNGTRTYGVSVIPAKGKNIVVVSHSE